MSSLVVEAAGLLTTVQDLGREGYGAMGVSPSGAADAVSLQLGNLLVGNEEGAAALEMTLAGGSFLFPEGATISLSGADFGATVGDASVEMWRSVWVPGGARLKLHGTKDSARCYLCVRGGFVVERFLGSASTHLLSGLGGWEGRALRKGDVLPIGTASKSDVAGRRLAAGILDAVRPRKTLRVTRGPQADWFSGESLEALTGSEFVVSEESNRMGLRLDGPRLTTERCAEMISEGAPLGAVQATPSGQAILLFVEQQTTGGYPKIANVIGADLHCVGQLRPRDRIRFEEVSMEEARRLWIEQERLLRGGEKLFA
jgi:antagonist of KipI